MSAYIRGYPRISADICGFDPLTTHARALLPPLSWGAQKQHPAAPPASPACGCAALSSLTTNSSLPAPRIRSPYPSHLSVTSIRGQAFAMRPYKLRVFLYQAINVPASDSTGSSDPFCVVRCGKSCAKSQARCGGAGAGCGGWLVAYMRVLCWLLLLLLLSVWGQCRSPHPLPTRPTKLHSPNPATHPSYAPYPPYPPPYPRSAPPPPAPPGSARSCWTSSCPSAGARDSWAETRIRPTFYSETPLIFS